MKTLFNFLFFLKSKTKRIVLILLVLENIVFPLSNVKAACYPPFLQVNENGFGNRLNLYSWSMKAFTGTSGGNRLYVATYSKWVGTEIWRYDGNTWEIVVSGGLGNPNNQGARTMMDFNGALYTGVWNMEDGAQLWRTDNGVDWSVIVTDGFGDASNESIRALAEYKGYFYAGTHNPKGIAQLWRTSDGDNWERVAIDNFDTTNSSFHCLMVFDGSLYAATRNTIKGAQLWRSEDGVTFEPVVGNVRDGAVMPSGFGDRQTAAIMHTAVFQGKMYIGTLNFRDGFDMRRMDSDLNFEKVGEDGFGYGGCADYAWRFMVFDGYLWMGGLNMCTGGTIWRTLNGDDWEQLVGEDSTLTPPVLGGFGDESNWGIRTMEVYEDRIYFGTAECFRNICYDDWDGTEVWEWQGECEP